MNPIRLNAYRLLRRVAAGLAGGLLLAGLGACGSMAPPQPWEKGELARPEMRMDGDPLEARFRAHVYASKEAASGGAGVGGGGCGCN